MKKAIAYNLEYLEWSCPNCQLINKIPKPFGFINYTGKKLTCTCNETYEIVEVNNISELENVED